MFADKPIAATLPANDLVRAFEVMGLPPSLLVKVCELSSPEEAAKAAQGCTAKTLLALGTPAGSQPESVPYSNDP
jgi:hypothetical protein